MSLVKGLRSAGYLLLSVSASERGTGDRDRVQGKGAALEALRNELVKRYLANTGLAGILRAATNRTA
jgi:hypothetical protein